jgi:S-adenosylmethionine:tRNA ribosyltransferase-isomerase
MPDPVEIDAGAGAGGEWRLDDFDYDLPPDLIAQHPLDERSASRLMIVRAGASVFDHTTVANIGEWLRPGDLLVANNSRVIPARIFARRAGSGGKVELLLLRQDREGVWTALARPARRLHPGDHLEVQPLPGHDAPGVQAAVVWKGDEGQIGIRFAAGAPDLAAYGVTPLPPYITAPLADANRYQTVYAREDGSAAAPTAGLHFTPELIASLQEQGIGWTEVTLHVGLDTFRPVAVERVADHVMHREWCDVSDATAQHIAETRRRGGRVIAIGTTAARTLETLGRVWSDATPRGLTARSGIFITPGYRWRLVDGMLTNFHLPKSTLIMMVSAFAGVETIRAAYATAIAERYRFYSFGDATLMLREDSTG